MPVGKSFDMRCMILIVWYKASVLVDMVLGTPTLIANFGDVDLYRKSGVCPIA